MNYTYKILLIQPKMDKTYMNIKHNYTTTKLNPRIQKRPVSAKVTKLNMKIKIVTIVD